MEETLQLAQNQTIVFIGDSITDAGRTEKPYSPYGFGYVHFTANYLLAKYPELNLRIINTGISGNTIGNLKNRWDKDCLNFKPDIISIMIGINDLWRKHTNQLDQAADAKEYEVTFERLLLNAKQKKNCQLMLCEPFMFCDNPADPMRKGLNAYIEAIHRIAEQFNATVVQIQKQIDEKIKQITSYKWSDDMVHPFVWAHFWISQQWIQAAKI